MNWTKPQPFTIEELDLLSIVIDPDIQPREGLDHEAVKDYAMAMMQGDQLPPLDVFLIEGVRKIAGGFHRYEAARQALKTSYKCNLYHGTQSDARLFALQANRTNGKRMSNADKARAVRIALEINPEWSDRKIGEHVGVDHKTVAVYRPRPAAPEPEPITPTPPTKPASQASRASGEIPQAAIYLDARIKDLYLLDYTEEESDRLRELRDKAVNGGSITNADYDEVDDIIKDAKYRTLEAKKPAKPVNDEPSDDYTPPLFDGLEDEDEDDPFSKRTQDFLDRIVTQTYRTDLSDKDMKTLYAFKEEVEITGEVPPAYVSFITELEKQIPVEPQVQIIPSQTPTAAFISSQTYDHDDGELPEFDQLGNRIERFNLKIAFGFAKALRGYAGKIYTIKMDIKLASEHTKSAGLDCKKFDQLAQQTYQMLREAEPYAICSKCQGIACQACNKRGWTTREEHARANAAEQPEQPDDMPEGLSPQSKIVLKHLRTFGPEGATQEEIAERGELDRASVSGRIPELRAMNLITEPEVLRRPTKKGKTAQVIIAKSKPEGEK